MRKRLLISRKSQEDNEAECIRKLLSLWPLKAKISQSKR